MQARSTSSPAAYCTQLTCCLLRSHAAALRCCPFRPEDASKDEATAKAEASAAVKDVLAKVDAKKVRKQRHICLFCVHEHTCWLAACMGEGHQYCPVLYKVHKWLLFIDTLPRLVKVHK